jgi:hypothetical protein
METPEIFIPDKLLDKLNEFTNGGYLIVFITNRNDVKVTAHFDNQVAQLAIHRTLEKYMDGVNAMEIAMSDDVEEDSEDSGE